jgi:hypothetical protein
VLEWNDGDGSDTATGGNGADLTRVNGSVTQGDAFEVAPNGPGIRFQRTNLVPFTIDLDTERLEMNTLGGDDTIAVKKGLAGRLRVLADGGSGTDRILARNGAIDRVQGGSGIDSAVVDRKDQVEDVEQVKRHRAGHAKVASKVKVALSNGRYVATLWVSCPASAGSSCHGVVRIRTAKGHVVLASKRLNLDPRERAKVKVKLSRKASSAVKGGKLSLRAVIV